MGLSGRCSLDVDELRPASLACPDLTSLDEFRFTVLGLLFEDKGKSSWILGTHGDPELAESSDE